MSDASTTDSRPTVAPSRVFSLSFSGAGVAVAALFFAMSLAPSLLPRGPLFQGFVSGVTVVIGYGLGVLAQWTWDYLELPKAQGRNRRLILRPLLAFIVMYTAASVWWHVGWQNDLRSLFDMEPVSPLVWFPTIPYTVVFAAIFLLLARSIRRLFHEIVRRLNRRMPYRLSRVLGGVALLVLLSLTYNGVLVTGFFAAANSAFSVSDGVTAPGVERPVSPLRSGSPDSLVAWGDIGTQGRSFVASGPTVADLDAFSGGGALEPIRVYAGLKSAASLQARADLVLEELKRTGAFDREVLVVATTTGTGYLDPNAIDPLEYLLNGDTAVVAVQYSYLPSWISLLADQQIVKETSRVVFDTVHGYWSTLPEEARPRFFIHGLSLGSFGAEAILTSIDVINEPIDGALLSGPPFLNELRNEIVEDRDPGSTPWLPIYDNGRTVRFTNRVNAIDVPTGQWQDTRIVYIQHASDPVVFFSPSLAFSRPDWLQEGQRGPDVSTEMFWAPLVTMWQVAADLAAASSVPEGYGHLYAASSYIDSWVGMAAPARWQDTDTLRLKDHFADLAAASADAIGSPDPEGDGSDHAASRVGSLP